MYFRGNSIGTDDGRQTTDDRRQTTDDGQQTTDDTITLALHGLEELFLQLRCCVSSLFWWEIGFGFTYYLCT